MEGGFCRTFADLCDLNDGIELHKLLAPQFTVSVSAKGDVEELCGSNGMTIWEMLTGSATFCFLSFLFPVSRLDTTKTRKPTASDKEDSDEVAASLLAAWRAGETTEGQGFFTSKKVDN